MLSVEKQVKLFIYIMYLCALLVGCAVGAVLLWKSFGDTRDTRIKVYTKDIQTWNDTKRDEYMGNEFRVQLEKSDDAYSDLSTVFGGFDQESVENTLEQEEDYDDFPDYEPYFYKLHKSADEFGIETLEEFNSTQTVKFRVRVDDGDSEQDIDLPPLDLYQIKSSHMSLINGCDKLKGHFSQAGQTCYVYRVLKNICIQMDKDDGGNWYVHKNRETGNFGCFSMMHNATQYELIQLPSGMEIEDMFPYTLSKMTFEIRSSYDPWLLAVVLTEDTNKFGMTGNELFFLGLGLIFCCGGLTIMPICWIWGKFRYSREVAESADRQGVYRNSNLEYDEFDVGTATVMRGPERASALQQSQGRNRDIRMADLDMARDNGLPSSIRKPKRVTKTVKNGEYESYYQE